MQTQVIRINGVYRDIKIKCETQTKLVGIS